MKNRNGAKELIFMLRELDEKEINAIKDIMKILSKTKNQVN